MCMCLTEKHLVCMSHTSCRNAIFVRNYVCSVYLPVTVKIKETVGGTIPRLVHACLAQSRCINNALSVEQGNNIKDLQNCNINKCNANALFNFEVQEEELSILGSPTKSEV